MQQISKQSSIKVEELDQSNRPENFMSLELNPVKKQESTGFHKKDKKGRNKIGRWTDIQKKIYFDFLLEHPDDFGTSFIRRSKQIFQQMADLIKTRNAEQCRGHHIKVEKLASSQNIKDIIKALIKKDRRKREKDQMKNEIMINKKKKSEQSAKIEERAGGIIKYQIHEQKKKEEPKISINCGEWTFKVNTRNLLVWNDN